MRTIDELVLGPGRDGQLDILVGGDESADQPQRVVRADLVVYAGGRRPG
ncbi:hypothetical protein [Nonomuraea africana]|nr:hypothetical protein [Nonomuraea africana]